MPVLDGIVIELSLSFRDVPFFVMLVFHLFFDFFCDNIGEYASFLFGFCHLLYDFM